MTGTNASFGEQLQRATDLAVADIDAAGGVLGQQVRVVTADDFCDPEQAVAAARKLVSDGVIFVVGHDCSHAAIPASETNEGACTPADLAGVDQPNVDRAGPCDVFRVIPRDNADAIVAGNYLADHWADGKIAILHDNTTWGAGIAEADQAAVEIAGA